MIERNEMLVGIIDLYDRIRAFGDKLTALDNENAHLHSMLNAQADEREARASSRIDMEAMEIGRREIYGNSVYSWQSVKAERVSGQVRYTAFDKFLDNYIGQIPAYVSRDEFTEYFRPELERDYEERKEEALRKLMADEGEEE